MLAWIEKAQFGVVNATTALSTSDQAKAVLRANPDISVVFAPYDEFARGVKLAATELGTAGKLKVYSADVSTADIRRSSADGRPVGCDGCHQSGPCRRCRHSCRRQAGGRRIRRPQPDHQADPA